MKNFKFFLWLTVLVYFSCTAHAQQDVDWSDPKRKIVINRPWKDVVVAISKHHMGRQNNEYALNKWLDPNGEYFEKGIDFGDKNDGYFYRFTSPNGRNRSPTEISYLRISFGGKDHTFSTIPFLVGTLDKTTKDLKEILQPTQAVAEEKEKRLTATLAPLKGKPFNPLTGNTLCRYDPVDFIESKVQSTINAHNSLIYTANTALTNLKSNPNSTLPPGYEPFFDAGTWLLMGCFKKDYEEAKYWLELGVSHNSNLAMHNLAWMHQNGFGVPKDEVKAASLYKKLLDSDILAPPWKRLSKENYELLGEEAISNANKELTKVLVSSNQPESSLLSSNSKISTSSEIKIPVSSTPQNLATAISSERPKVIINSGKRRALLIGNDSYKFAPKLLNAREDATALSDSLKNVGFQVTLKLDLNEKDMKAALRTFAAQVEGGDEVVVFFAGHGVQIGNVNFLLPVDIAGDNEAQVKDEAIQLQRILDDMAERKARLTLAMIDACRDNPFKSSGRAIGGRGLGSTTAATGQMIIFSAGTGQQALDKLGPSDKNRNGLFTRIFLKEMKKPGISVDRVLRNVRTEVVELAKSVGHEQVPAIYDQVVGDFYFLK